MLNSSTGSRITELNNIDFKDKAPQTTKLGDLENLRIKNVYILIGAAKWVENTKTALCG